MWLTFVAQADVAVTLDERLQRVFSGLGTAGLDFVVAMAVVLVGWAVAVLAARLVQWLLRVARFNETVHSLLGPKGATLRIEPAATVSWGVHWLIILLAAMVAADILGFDLSRLVSERLRDVLPRVVAATIVLAVGVLVAMLVGTVVRSLLAGAGVKGSRIRSQIVVAILVGFTVLLSLEQLGLAAQFIGTIGLTAVAAVGLAVGLAIGLGCRDMARDLIVEYLRSSGEEAAPR
jgi:hypothetical protein